MDIRENPVNVGVDSIGLSEHITMGGPSTFNEEEFRSKASDVTTAIIMLHQQIGEARIETDRVLAVVASYVRIIEDQLTELRETKADVETGVRRMDMMLAAVSEQFVSQQAAIELQIHLTEERIIRNIIESRIHMRIWRWLERQWGRIRNAL